MPTEVGAHVVLAKLRAAHEHHSRRHEAARAVAAAAKLAVPGPSDEWQAFAPSVAPVPGVSLELAGLPDSTRPGA